jgi:RNA polymerase sigma-70 factor (ECF subfamily)
MSQRETIPVQVLLREQRRFLAFLERRLRDPATAEDVLQEAYVKAVRKAGALREDQAVIPWFYQVLRNSMVDHVRKRDARVRAEAEAAGAAEGEQRDDDLRAAICECVTGLLPDLRGDQADLLRRVEVEGERVKDVAETLGITASAAAVRLHRARRALAEALGAVCGACAQHGCRDCQCRGRGAGSAGM